MSVYYYECHTCDDDGTFPNRKRAQTVFNEHAQQRHEVVLRRVESPPVERTPEPVGDATPKSPEDDTGAGENDPVAD